MRSTTSGSSSAEGVTDIHGVELVRVEALTALVVPLPNIVELRTERDEYVVRRCRALRILSDRLDVFHGGLPTRGPPAAASSLGPPGCRVAAPDEETRCW